MPKPEVTKPVVVSEGIHVYTLNGDVWVGLGSEGLPVDYRAEESLPWSDEYFRGDCLEFVKEMETLLRTMGSEPFNEWLRSNDKEDFLLRVRQGKHVKQGQVIQRPTEASECLEEDGE